MEVALPASPPSPAVDFNFDSNCSSPYMTAPSSPQRFANFYFSAPTSPSRPPSALYDGSTAARNSTSSAIPFDWEEIPLAPQNRASQNGCDQGRFIEDDFAFDFSGNLERISLSAADELFDGGKIRPMKPPIGKGSGSSVSSPRSPRSKKMLFPLSPRHRKSSGSVGPSAAAIEETNRSQKQKQRGGRERRSNPGFAHKGSRSLSPIRISDIIFEQDDEGGISSNTKAAQSSPSSSTAATTPMPTASSSIASIFSAVSFAKSYRKWKLRDFLLFRSASEGRATGKEAIGKYAALSSKKAVTEDLKNSSFRSTESSGPSRGRGPAMSAHEMHYTVNRAVAEEMRRKTLLPYKQGLLGCLGFNQEISRGIGSLTRGRS